MQNHVMKQEEYLIYIKKAMLKLISSWQTKRMMPNGFMFGLKLMAPSLLHLSEKIADEENTENYSVIVWIGAFIGKEILLNASSLPSKDSSDPLSLQELSKLNPPNSSVG